ncbi:MAG: ElyC/SanA/YdcF family protein [Bacteroidia bacterium]
MNKRIKPVKKIMLLSLLLIMVSVANYYVYKIATHRQIFFSVAPLKNYHRVLILGAGKNNPVFYSRMNAALKLYRTAEIEKITCSGLTGVVNYSEPYDMRDYLLQNKVPDSIIVLDTAGNHTYNSVVNYANQHKGDSVIIVSQAQHLNRALFIANCKGLRAVGFAASGFHGDYNREWAFTEFLSRIKCSFNLVFNS